MSQPTTRGCLAIRILALTLCSVGCEDTSEDADSGPEVVVRDSAGVSIVENDAPAPDSRLPWEFGTQPSLSIGAVDSGEADQLFQVTDATRLPDGRIVIANSGSNELRAFNADGSHAATWGGRGEGPGEFVSYSPTVVASWPGDSIAAVNPWGTRLSLFDADGNHGRDVPLDASLLNVVDLLPDGNIFTSGSGGLRRNMTGSSGLVRSNAEWGILDADGTLLASLGEFPGSEFYAIFAPDGSLEGGMPHPFGHGTMGAVWGKLVAIGVQDSYEIKAFATDGSLVRTVRRAGDLESPAQADLDEYYARRYADLPDEDRISNLNAVRDMPLVESWPAFSEILSDRAGYLWVREYRTAAWTVFDPEGRVQGLIETPPDLRTFEIGEDYILGWVYDELGVEYVQLWSLSREIPS
ncbi:6-bladed beta-propeller [Candidatus Palauibacter sp.]|uniref:6-bladed beta-propeller n=1 Tax=Candidatus Palauibacter sp. TaxID=3101350 RepID=UPI003AF299B5